MGRTVTQYVSDDGKKFKDEASMLAHEFAVKNAKKLDAFANKHFDTQANRTRAKRVVALWELNKKPSDDEL